MTKEKLKTISITCLTVAVVALMLCLVLLK